MTTTVQVYAGNLRTRCPWNERGAWVAWAWIGALALLVTAAAAAPANAAGNQRAKTFIPKIADIAGIRIGYSSMDELERHLGKGKVTVGGHPNGARLWRVKGTSRVIYADAFDYSQRGAVVDSFAITMGSRPAKDVPYARVRRKKLAWGGGISLGMDEDRLLKVLKRNSWAATKVADGWLVEARGHSPLTSVPEPFNQWTARFTITGKSVVAIRLEARQQERK